MPVDFGDITLSSERLILRPLEISDDKDMFELARVPIVGERTGFKPHGSVEDTRELLSSLLISPKNRAVILKDGNVFAGVIGLFDARIDGMDRDGEFGYWLGVPFWGKGIMPEAVRTASEYAFKSLGLRSVWIRCKTTNPNSERVAIKCGFTYTRTVNEKGGNGLMSDFKHYRLINPYIKQS